jgi:hypothetical protein
MVKLVAVELNYHNHVHQAVLTTLCKHYCGCDEHESTVPRRFSVACVALLGCILLLTKHCLLLSAAGASGWRYIY